MKKALTSGTFSKPANGRGVELYESSSDVNSWVRIRGVGELCSREELRNLAINLLRAPRRARVAVDWLRREETLCPTGSCGYGKAGAVARTSLKSSCTTQLM